MNLFHELQATTAADIGTFEAIALAQTPAIVPWTPVTDYSPETRMKIERAHARLLLDTFNPKSAMDVGSGFGYLVDAVNAIAGHTLMFGMDKDNPAADFHNDIVTLWNWKGHARTELVVCREVLEHLTLIEIGKAVRHLCRLAQRFVYVTTRFSSEHAITHVETSDDLDPTHITLAAKDFYRLLFTLEGFKRRADLEEKLDHLKKGRVLVYERVL